MPDDWIIKTKVQGRLIYITDGPERSPYKVAHLMGPDGRDLIERLEHARIEAKRPDGSFAIVGEQRPAGVKGPRFAVVGVAQRWLCYPSVT